MLKHLCLYYNLSWVYFIFKIHAVISLYSVTPLYLCFYENSGFPFNFKFNWFPRRTLRVDPAILPTAFTQAGAGLSWLGSFSTEPSKKGLISHLRGCRGQGEQPKYDCFWQMDPWQMRKLQLVFYWMVAAFLLDV